jgi:ATP-dependent Lhr-like helicase
VQEASPTVGSADELHDLLLEQGALAEPDALALGWQALFEQLVSARRAARLGTGSDGRTFWVAAERRSLALLAWPAAHLVPDVVEPTMRKAPAWTDHEGAVIELVRGRLALVGPTTAPRLARDLALGPAEVEAALCQIELAGVVLRGSFGVAAGSRRDGGDGAGDVANVTEWCDRRLLARIHRRTLERLRKEIEPVSVSDLVRFLCEWQHVRPGAQLTGREGLRLVVEQLQGFEAAAGAWEQEILPARLADYEPAWLDELCLGGEVTWGRFECRVQGNQSPTRSAPIGLGMRRDLPWLLGPRIDDQLNAPVAPPGDPFAEPTDPPLSAGAREVLAFLERAGASFVEDIVPGVKRLRAEVEEALWELLAAGRITADGFAALRGLLPVAGGQGGGARRRWYAKWKPTRQRAGLAAGRWSLLRVLAPAGDDERLEAQARQYLRRWGVVFRELLRREPHAPPWRELVRVYRRLELRGEVRGGRLVGGVVGEQFASPEALLALRATRKTAINGEVIALSACDPLNLVGLITPGARIASTLANTVIYRDGVPVDETGTLLPLPGDAGAPEPGVVMAFAR